VSELLYVAINGLALTAAFPINLDQLDRAAPINELAPKPARPMLRYRSRSDEG
jgi:hypothetical protein